METLKAKAYDIMAQIQYLQNELQKINQQIAEESNKQLEVKEESKEK